MENWQVWDDVVTLTPSFPSPEALAKMREWADRAIVEGKLSVFSITCDSNTFSGTLSPVGEAPPESEN